jgi:ribonuclease HII
MTLATRKKPVSGGLDLAFERDLAPARVAGVDEAGRGPLAGPVAAAAVILDPTRIPAGLDDSKKLTHRRREALFEAIVAEHRVALAFVPAARIDATDIRRASLEAMARAVAALGETVDHVLVDGNAVPPGLPCPATSLIGGDGRCASIAAASIVAKVVRDRAMVDAAAFFPGFGFEIHKGYPTPAHMAALARLGPSPIHRLTFAPVAAALIAIKGRKGG